MNISNRTPLIRPTENPYHQFRPLNGLNSTKNNNPAMAKTGPSTTNLMPTAPENILSIREKETLQALFSGTSKEHTFYGTAKAGNIQSGFLLDIKG